MAVIDDLKRMVPPTGNLDFELVGHEVRAGRLPVHSFEIRTTLESGERVEITQEVAHALSRKTNKDGALNEGGMGYYKPDAIAGELAEVLYNQDRYKHTFKVRTEESVGDAEKQKHDQIIDLQAAVKLAETDNVQSLLSQGADPNALNQYGQTPLHLVGHDDYSDGYAASGETARVLLLSGANPNAKDENGNTPLHGAMNAPVAQVLLEGGADASIKNKWGSTPLENQRDRMGDAAEVIETFEKRQSLVHTAQQSRPPDPEEDTDLASPDEVMAHRRTRGMRM